MSKTPDDGQRNCPKHVELYSKIKFEKLTHLVGFIIRIYHDARSSECKILKFGVVEVLKVFGNFTPLTSRSFKGLLRLQLWGQLAQKEGLNALTLKNTTPSTLERLQCQRTECSSIRKTDQ
jgi:hypothetical protein